MYDTMAYGLTHTYLKRPLIVYLEILVEVVEVQIKIDFE